MMRNEDGRMDERLMSDEAVEEAVLRYLEESPDLDTGLAPERDLWPGIEARIGARVLPLGRESVRARIVRRRPAWLPMAAAAALLVASTSGVTYLLTRHLSAPATGATPVAQTAANAATRQADTQQTQAQPPATEANAAPTTSTSTATVEPQHAVADADRAETSPVNHEKSAPEHEPVQHDVTPTTRLASYQPSSREDEARAAYDDEITRLHETLESRRQDLDPATVATVEQNLRVIDNAIHQAKAALAKDPHSRLLNDQLDHTLAKKTELLRAATLLPSA
jgi:hypothetical protein